MIKTILVAASGTSRTKAALATAATLSRLFGAHFECLHVRRDPTQMLAQAASADIGSGVIIADMLDALKLENTKRCDTSRAAFDEICAKRRIALADRPGAGEVSACWREETGDEAERLLHRARAHDLMVIEHPSGHGMPAGVPGSLVIGTGRPVLVAPAEARENATRTIVLAWKDTSETARVVTAAMPLFAKAEKIIVLSASEDVAKEAEARVSLESVIEHLRWHGLKPEARLLATGNALDSVIAAVGEINPDLLVMGGYGHGRFREFVFGGFTRQVLSGISAPTFLLH